MSAVFRDLPDCRYHPGQVSLSAAFALHVLQEFRGIIAEAVARTQSTALQSQKMALLVERTASKIFAFIWPLEE